MDLTSTWRTIPLMRAIAILVLLGAISPLRPQSPSQEKPPTPVKPAATDEIPVPDLSAGFLKPSEDQQRQLSTLIASLSNQKYGTGIGSGPERSPFCNNGENDECYKISSPGVSPPVAIFTPQPQYPKSAAKLKKEELEVLHVIIGADGKIYSPQVIRSLGKDFDATTIAAIQYWRFKPAIRKGKPVAMIMNLEISFEPYDAPKPAPQVKS